MNGLACLARVADAPVRLRRALRWRAAPLWTAARPHRLTAPQIPRTLFGGELLDLLSARLAARLDFGTTSFEPPAGGPGRPAWPPDAEHSGSEGASRSLPSDPAGAADVVGGWPGRPQSRWRRNGIGAEGRPGGEPRVRRAPSPADVRGVRRRVDARTETPGPAGRGGRDDRMRAAVPVRSRAAASAGGAKLGARLRAYFAERQADLDRRASPGGRPSHPAVHRPTRQGLPRGEGRGSDVRWWPAPASRVRQAEPRGLAGGLGGSESPEPISGWQAAPTVGEEPAVSGAFRVDLGRGEALAEDDLADRLAAVLRDQARRHGVPLA